MARAEATRKNTMTMVFAPSTKVLAMAEGLIRAKAPAAMARPMNVAESSWYCHFHRMLPQTMSAMEATVARQTSHLPGSMGP